MIALVPLFVVAIAYGIAAAAVYGLVEAGVFEVNGQTTSLLIVLMFGAGTDYCLLIVSRYREELRRFEDKHEAMAHATERTGPAILSAGATVFAAMLVLTLADFKATQTMGPVLALGVAVMLLAGLTLLPALLAALGRNSFWPAIPRHGTEQQAPLGIWRRVGHFVHERPTLALVISVGILALGALGLLQDRGIIDFGEGFRDPPESVDGQLLIEDAARGRPDRGDDRPRLDGRGRGGRRRGRAGSTASRRRSRPGSRRTASSRGSTSTLAYDPFSDEANDTIPGPARRGPGGRGRRRGAGRRADGGELRHHRDPALGREADRAADPAADLRSSSALLLRAIVAPLYLVATVVLSYAFALGATTLIFTEIFNQPDSDPGLPTFAFIFLVALGVDYNIFLISRIREEAAHQETKEAVITGLERTGGVITSAGLILAGTFFALMSLPLEALFQIGFTIAFGLLVDTFLVRTILVPAIAFKLGERNWWPSRIAHDQPAREPTG